MFNSPDLEAHCPLLSDPMTCVESFSNFAPGPTVMALTGSIELVLSAFMGPECFASNTEPTECEPIP